MTKTRSYPNFLQKRVDYYYNVRLKKLEGGSLFEGPLPKSSDIFIDNNDYLCLSNHSEIIDCQINELRHSEKSLMSNVFAYERGIREDFETGFAVFTNQEDAMLCTSGLDANIGLLQTICEKDTHLYMDKMVHMSLYMGAQFSRAILHIFEHNNVNMLEDLVREFGVGVVVVDSVYSSFGSVCPLKEVAEVATKYGCILVVDESHSIGLYGSSGAGMVAELGLEEQVDFITASLSKAFCSRGGIITCSSQFRAYFRQASFPAIYSSMMLNHEAARFLKTLEIIKKADDRREKLLENMHYLHTHLDNIGFNTEISQSQILSLEVGNEMLAIKLRDLLMERGVVAAPFIPLAVPKNRCNARMTVNSGLTTLEMEHIVKSCKEVLPLVTTSIIE
jgi:CAI-1 autoinducer synthase